MSSNSANKHAATSAIDTALARAWCDGCFRGDAAALRELAAAHPRHPRAVELGALATLASLLEGEGALIAEVAPAAPGERAVVRCLVHAAAAWHAAAHLQLSAATDQLDALDRALADARADGLAPPLATAQAFADLAIGECARIGGDRAIWRRRLVRLTAAPAPGGLRLAVRYRLALDLAGPHELPRAVRRLDEAVRLAEWWQRPRDAQYARRLAGMLAFVGGDLPGARQRLQSIVDAAGDAAGSAAADPTPFDRLLLAWTKEPGDAMAEFAEGVRLAAERGDLVTYSTFIIMGARMYAALGRDVDAVATLSNAIGQLRRADRDSEGLASALIDERDQLRRRWGEPRFHAALDGALRQLTTDMGL